MTATRLAVLAALVAWAAACAHSGAREYRNSDLELVTAYTAKETCSCLFVMEQSEAFCRAWTQASPAIAGWTADPAKRTVESSALLFWSAKARFVGSKFGCALE